MTIIHITFADEDVQTQDTNLSKLRKEAAPIRYLIIIIQFINTLDSAIRNTDSEVELPRIVGKKLLLVSFWMHVKWLQLKNGINSLQFQIALLTHNTNF